MREVVRAAGLLGFRRLVRELGGDAELILGRVGLEERQLNDPDRYIPYRNVLSALEEAARVLEVADFGLRLAARQDLAFLGALSLAIQSATSVRAGLAAAQRHIHFHAPAITLFLSEPDVHGLETVRLGFLMRDLPSISQAAEHAVGHLCKVVAVLSDGGLAPSSVHFRHTQIASAGVYRHHLGCLPSFCAGFDGIVVPSVDARRPLPNRNRQLQAFVERFMIGIAPTPDMPLEEQVREVLQTLMRVQDVRLQDVARILHLHPRTLQRRLQQAGTRFDLLQDDTRRQVTAQLLAQKRVPLSQIARIAGFADQPALNRACRRWFDVTPGMLRRQLVQQAAGSTRASRGG